MNEPVRLSFYLRDLGNNSYVVEECYIPCPIGNDSVMSFSQEDFNTIVGYTQTEDFHCWLFQDADPNVQILNEEISFQSSNLDGVTTFDCTRTAGTFTINVADRSLDDMKISKNLTDAEVLSHISNFI